MVSEKNVNSHIGAFGEPSNIVEKQRETQSWKFLKENTFLD